MKTKINVAIQKITPCVGQEAGFKHGLRVSEMQLKHMSASIQINTY